MILPRYQELKDSGIDYLGAIPSTWSIKRLGDIVSFSQGKAHEPYIDDDGDYICVNSRFVSTAGKTLKKCTVNLTPASLNDILMVMSDLPNGRALARAYYVRDNGKYAVNQRVCRITAEKADSSFLFYLLDRHPGLMQNDDGVHQTHLSNDDFLKLKLYLPSFSEQTQIARFLDHETARIDALIEEQQRLIELLKEKRQAVISHAVTKGLDPTVPMKDSGVEWLGEVPAHWERKRLKNISPQITVGIVVNPSEYISADGLPYLYGAEVKEGWIDLEGSRSISPDDSKKNPKTMLAAGDLVTMRVGYPGITAVVTPECEGGNCASIILIRKGKFDSHWLCAAMNSQLIRHQVELVQYGAAQKAFNVSDAVEFWLYEPPYSEQCSIANFISAQSLVFDNLITEANKSAIYLQERRSALISAAVTGKIDVRGWQPPASTQTPELAVAEAV